MRINLAGYRYQDIGEDWLYHYRLLIKASLELGLEVRVSPYLRSVTKVPNVKVGIIDSEDDIYVYNHCTVPELEAKNFFFGRKTLILKPSGPGPEYFSLDTLGYASYSSITYNKPLYDSVNEVEFEQIVGNLKNNRANKWDKTSDVPSFTSPSQDIPSNHTLVLGQMPGDETVTKFSFGEHFTKLTQIVNEIDKTFPIVVKLHPYLLINSNRELCNFYNSKINEWRSSGITVLSGFESLHDILPNTRVAVVENSTAGIECMLYSIPIISYGFPEYHWITRELRHLVNINNYIEDLSWFSLEGSKKFTIWYLRDYLCSNLKSTVNRLKYHLL
jgi:hypothetical protein